MNTNRSLLPVLLGLAISASCGGGGSASSGGSASDFVVLEVSNGFGKLLPHQVRELSASGAPTAQVIEVTRIDQLLANLTRGNPIRPSTEWPTGAVLPDIRPGNQFIYARFSQPLDIAALISRDPADGPGQLSGGVQVRSVNPVNGTVTPIRGKAFIGGQTFGPGVTGGELDLTTWIEVNALGGLTASTIGGDQPGLGFPGTQTGFAGDTALVGADTLVFVADADGDLETHEAFPSGVQIQMVVDASVRSARGRLIAQQALASSTVGPDAISPEVLVTQGSQAPIIVPGNDAIDVDPQTNIRISFTEPIQPLKLGELEDGTPAALSASVQVRFGPSNAIVEVPFHVRPISVLDLTTFDLVPIYDFPGTGPIQTGATCGTFGSVSVTVNPTQIDDLTLVPNQNAIPRSTKFFTRDGPGLVNAPVTPDAVYIGRTGSNQGISVIDLNGFGAGTGNPTYDFIHPIVQGNSNYPNNPNVTIQGTIMVPPLEPGTCTFNGGSEGVFTLTKDSSLNALVARAPLLESVGEMALGHALDNTFNNETFGCQAGGGNICASSGLKRIALISGGPNTVASANFAAVNIIKTDDGVENLASWAPHPNPPPLTYPPLCLSPLINAIEPSSVFNILPPPVGLGLTNLLGPGPFPLGLPDIGLPPQGTLVSEQNCFFEGPHVPQPNITACPRFMQRQQVGQFLYVLDRVASEIVVFNSNRFTVLDRIRLPDPTSLAVSPNLDFLAVTNEGADLVAFLDIDPASATFHQVIETTTVGAGPTGIAWEPGNEDIFVCNQSEGTISILSAFTLKVRKTLRNQISQPIEVSITPRQTTYGFLRGVYFAYILNQNGRVAFFESGPDGINGIGFDDVIASLPFTFQRPKTMQADPTNLNSGVWIVHERPLGEDGQPTGGDGGAISNVGIAGGTVGVIPLDAGAFGNPQLRQLEFGVLASFGEGQGGLSGIPVDVAFDNMRNVSALTNLATQFSAGTPLGYNGKALVKSLQGAAVPGSTPQFMFLAVPNPGVVDVFNMTSSATVRFDTNSFIAGVQSIPAPNASVLMDYFRQ